MNDRSTLITAPLARWSSRIALFAASLVLVGIALHRLTSFPTHVAMNLFGVALGFAALAVLVAIVALAQIWRRGLGGAGSAAVGILLPLVLFGGPLIYLSAYLHLPRLNDVSTDLNSPPRFATLARQRGGDANPAAYPGARFAQLQQSAYPDLRTLVLDRSVDETFELVEEAVRRLRWKVAATEAPAIRPARAGLLEATDQTLLVGFPDDVVIRVEGSATRSRVDVRSASRYGQFDVGQNATRVRRFLVELQTRADATAPGTPVRRRGLRTTRTGAMAKKLKEADQKKVEGRSARDRVRSGAQRGQGQKETPR
jgi:hypothetical protein